MSKSTYMADLRSKIGHDLVLVPGVAAIIHDSEGSILVQRNKDGVWNLPAGAIDPGESPAQATVREVFEETGLIVRPTHIIGVLGGTPGHRITYANGDVIESTTIVFSCEAKGGSLKPQDDETEKLEYFSLDEMPELAVKYPVEMLSSDSKVPFFEWNSAWLNILSNGEN